MKKTYKLKTDYKKILADTLSPVSIYLKIRDKFPNSMLLESSDYHGNDNSFSYICCNPMASIKVHGNTLTKVFPDSTKESYRVENNEVTSEIHQFTTQFETEKNVEFKFINNGLFGYTSYDAVKYFETIDIASKENSIEIPEIQYAVYQNIIAINHFKNEAYIFSHCYEKESNINELHHIITMDRFAVYDFETANDINSNLSDEEFKKHVEIAKTHCQRGDVFQLVLSRKFQQDFKGDDFNVYRALRSINPSPYLFYFDYGSFKIFGSSPEAQLVVKNKKAEIHPIAGTFARTGNDMKDSELAQKLVKDEKENSEHVMLVDLARNDLSRHCTDVTVENYREIQFFSHVIHLVSKVIGTVREKTSTIQIVADTFPAGTLSGAPKYKAMELIEKYEKTSRGFYGGAIGFMDFKGNYNHAIMIRTFLSKNQQLHWQAGAGIVSKSNSDNELQEVYNKLGALTKAIKLAENI
ncbi:MAG: anthranilate synthase component I family protein [Bacteroidetes bacterium]|nr:anthranilate synthase component I family protein [Bacteroidota bacterium]MDA0860524.1 anthranilate synthase component I family protein [Bacteroidota bacterium]MDA1318736.1 anthranilate synthase component I family protein [Bacteroidota bacterium]